MRHSDDTLQACESIEVSEILDQKVDLGRQCRLAASQPPQLSEDDLQLRVGDSVKLLVFLLLFLDIDADAETE